MNSRIPAIALAAVALVAGCAKAGPTTAARPARLDAAAARTSSGPPAAEDKTSYWSGDIAGKLALMSFRGAAVEADYKGGHLSASVWPGVVSGFLNLPAGGSPTVSLDFVMGDMSGFIGQTPARGTDFGPGTITGRVGSKHLRMQVLGGSIRGELNGKTARFHGPGLADADRPGLLAALLCLTYLVD